MLTDEDKIRRQLAGFLQHGVQFDTLTPEQARGACPFCERAEKFFANPVTRCWDCKTCGCSGKFPVFLQKNAERYQEHFNGGPAVRLSKDRRLPIKALRRLGVGWSPSQNWYSLPVYDAEGHVSDIQRYSLTDKVAKSTTGRDFGCFRSDTPSTGNRVWVCEGMWDAAALLEVFTELGIDEDVIGLPGANNFHLKMGSLFDNRHVVLCMDHDTAGEMGSERFVRLFGTIAKSLTFIHWPSELKVGYDLRDLYVEYECKAKPFWEALQPLIQKGLPGQAPSTTVDANGRLVSSTPIAGVGRVTESQPEGDGLPHEEVFQAYRKWLHLPDAEPVSVLFGTLLANRFDGDPLWMFLVAPPGGAKSELIMSLNDAPLTYSTTSLTPHSLISGATFGQGDPSLIPRLNGKVLTIKDFTAILSMNQLAREEIFGVLRDAYDGRTEKHFGNGAIRKYESRFGIFAGVTPAIDAFASSSVLGERFLKYRIPEAQTGIGSSHASVMRALENVTHEAEMREDLSKIAKQTLTRTVTIEDQAEVSKEMDERIAVLARWVSRLRAVVCREHFTGYVAFKPCAEVPTRLSKQLKKLGLGISAFLHESVLSEETYQILVKVARDTSPDRVEMVVKMLYLHRNKGFVSTNDVSDWIRFPSDTVRFILQDLCLLGVVQKRVHSAGDWQLHGSIVETMERLKLYVREESWVRGRADVLQKRKFTVAKKNGNRP